MSEHDVSPVAEAGEEAVRESGLWSAKFMIAKFHGEWCEGATPYEVIETDNLLMYGGVSCLWQALIGNGTATAGQALTFFSNAQAAVGVGDSTAAAVATHNNLQAATNKFRRAMDSGFPTHTDGTVSGAATITLRSTFATTEANYSWEELAVFNSATDGTGRMLNRKVQSLGVKTSSSSWQVGCSISIG